MVLRRTSFAFQDERRLSRAGLWPAVHTSAFSRYHLVELPQPDLNRSRPPAGIATREVSRDCCLLVEISFGSNQGSL